MTTHAKTLEELIRELPPHEREAVRNFVEALLSRPAPAEGEEGSRQTGSFEALFGSWESGDSNSADNERIEADLAREYADPHEPVG